MKINSPLLPFTLLALFLLSGCATTTTQQHSGYFSSYQGFVDSKDYDYTKTYNVDASDREALAQVKSINLVPFEMWLSPASNANFNAQQLAGLSRYFHAQLGQKLQKNGFNIVDSAGSETLTIKGAFSGISFSAPELAPTDFIPFRIVLNAGNAAYLQVTDKKDVITEVSIEAEFLIGEQQQRIFALIATKYVDATVANSGSDNVLAVQQLLDVWVTNFVAKLSDIKSTN
ncbi:MAG: lipoprotein [Osedax symbiont Rs2]|nr:MAG: lipoprotein [Osedax symbiont Rs2]